MPARRAQSRRPNIGVTTACAVVGDRATDLAQREYAAAVAGAGGIPRLLPALASLPAADVADGLDGLLLTGGGDVNPARYGAPPSPEIGGVDDERDEAELGLVDAALGRSVPILGICRGCQLLNVALGGTLLQHLPVVSTQPHLLAAPRGEVVHTVHVEEGSQLHRALGRSAAGVNSIHHQGIDELAPGLRAVAWAEDGLVEAVEHRSAPVMAVQWHPESIIGQPGQLGLFEWLVRRAPHPHAARAPGEALRAAR